MSTSASIVTDAAQSPRGVAFRMLPRQTGGPAPTLLLFAVDGTNTLTTEPYCRVGRLLHAQGWNVVSLDLPCHGADRRPGESPELAGWAARVKAGEDIVAAFQEHVNDVLAHLVATGMADPDRIAAAGISRGGFMAFHAAAANLRIRAVAAFAPVTDLLALSEFAGQEQNPLVKCMALINAADRLANRAAWITIGNADTRVDTNKAVAFARALAAAGQARALACNVILGVLPTPGHCGQAEWHDAAATWLSGASAASPEAAPSLKSGPPKQKMTMSQILLAIDDITLPLRKNVCLYLNKPVVRREPVLSPSPADSKAPDNRAAHFYGTVLHDAGRFRMWYYACHLGRNPDWPPRKMQQIAKKPSWQLGETEQETGQGPLCYAESDDGIHWTKPALGQVLFKGSRDNNALDLPHTIVSGAAVIKDETDPDPARRYKMIYQFFPDQTDPVIPEYGTLPSIACAVSPNGLQWTVTAMPFVNQFVEHCAFIRHNGQYIVHSQVFCGTDWCGAYAEGGTAGGRMGIAHATCDFDRWPDLWEWAFALPEPADPAKRGVPKPYDQVHLGVGAASFGNVCVGLYGLWHDRVEFGDISCDLGLVVSNDGIRFREVGATPGQPYIHRDGSPARPATGRAFHTILCQGNGILNVGDDTRIYHGRWRNAGQKAEDIAKHYSAEVALATLPRDRWGALALNPGAESGAICSAPVVVPAGCELRINADGVAGLSVDLLDERFNPIPGFTGGVVTEPDGLDCPVRWDGHAPTELAGRAVRVRIGLKRVGESQSRVFALYLVKGAAS